MNNSLIPFKAAGITIVIFCLILLLSCTNNQKIVSESSIPAHTIVSEKEKQEQPKIISDEQTSHPKDNIASSEKIQESKYLNSSLENKTTAKLTPPSKTIISPIETFDGQIISDNKYNTKIIGKGSIKQNNRLMMNGSSDYGIIWDTLYTQKKYTLLDNFNISAQINLSGDVSIGNIKAIIGIDTLNFLASDSNHELAYCELNIGTSDRIIRMSKTVKHLDKTTPNTGIMTLTYNNKLEKLTCTFNGEIITQYQHGYSGEHYGFLRAGLNYISTGGLQSEGIGSFTATFDNWKIQQE